MSLDTAFNRGENLGLTPSGAQNVCLVVGCYKKQQQQQQQRYEFYFDLIPQQWLNMVKGRHSVTRIWTNIKAPKSQSL